MSSLDRLLTKCFPESPLRDALKNALVNYNDFRRAAHETETRFGKMSGWVLHSIKRAVVEDATAGTGGLSGASAEVLGLTDDEIIKAVSKAVLDEIVEMKPVVTPSEKYNSDDFKRLYRDLIHLTEDELVTYDERVEAGIPVISLEHHYNIWLQTDIRVFLKIKGALMQYEISFPRQMNSVTTPQDINAMITQVLSVHIFS